MGQVLFLVSYEIELPQLFARVLGGVPDRWVHEAIEEGLFTYDQVHGRSSRYYIMGVVLTLFGRKR